MIDAREYLGSIKEAESLLQLKIRQLRGLQDRLTSISAPMDKEVVSHTRNVGIMSDTIAMIVDMQHDIDQQASEILKRKREAYRMLDQIQPECATALMEYYFEGKSITQIAGIVHLSKRQTQRRLHDAIEAFQTLLNENECVQNDAPSNAPTG